MASSLRFALLGLAVLGVLGTSPEEKFQQFEAFYGQNSAGEEREARLAAFKDNLVVIDQLNREDQGTAVYSHLSPFADLTPEDFSVRCGLKTDLAMEKMSSPVLDTAGLPTSLDWRSKGAVNPVKNQGQCGSCWAFSTVANIEGAGFVTTGRLLSFSEQQLVDCSTSSAGCNGGLPLRADDEMATKKWGLELESSYPYKSGSTQKAGSCKAHSGSEVAFVSDYAQISTNEDQIASALMQFGPLSIGINAPPIQSYSHGISDLGSRCPADLDHAVTLVGFGEESSFFWTTKYWTVRNSWGSNWGEQGYIRFVRGKGACGLNQMVSTAKGISFKGASVAV